MNFSDEEVSPVKRRKKGIVNSASYKRNIIKKAKLEGKGHVNWAGKTIPAKEPASNVCR